MAFPINLIPKRKIAQEEAESVLLARALTYLNSVLQGRLDSVIHVSDTDLAAHKADTTTHGATGAVVGTTNTQTLTNKTLTAPTLTSAIMAMADHLTLHITDADGTTEADLWYDASEDKLKFKTAAGVETITSA